MKFLKVAVLFFGLAAAFAVRAQGGTYPVSESVEAPFCSCPASTTAA